MSTDTPTQPAPRPRRTTIKDLEAQIAEMRAQMAANQAQPEPEPTPQVQPTPQPNPQPAPQAQAQPAPTTTPPRPSGITTEQSELVRNLGIIVLSLGAVGLLVWKMGGAEVLALLMYIALPLFVLTTALKWTSKSTMAILYGGKLRERIDAYMDEARLAVQKQQGATT